MADTAPVASAWFGLEFEGDAIDVWKWRKLVEDGAVDQARKNGAIVMFNETGSEIARWHIFNAWPSKLVGPTTDATNNEVGIEEIELTVEGYYREGVPPTKRTSARRWRPGWSRGGRNLLRKNHQIGTHQLQHACGHRGQPDNLHIAPLS
jgi:hypothetical protein